MQRIKVRRKVVNCRLPVRKRDRFELAFISKPILGKEIYGIDSILIFERMYYVELRRSPPMGKSFEICEESGVDRSTCS